MTWRSDSASEAFRGMSSKLRPPEFDGSGGGGDRVSDEDDEKGRDTDRDNCRAPLADLRPCHRRDFMSITTRPLWLATYSADALLLDFIFTRMDPSSKRSRKISKQIKESISKGAGDWLAWPPFKFRTKDAACVFVKGATLLDAFAMLECYSLQRTATNVSILYPLLPATALQQNKQS